MLQIFNHGFDTGFQAWWLSLLQIPNVEEEMPSLVTLSTGRDPQMISPHVPRFSKLEGYFSLLPLRHFFLQTS